MPRKPTINLALPETLLVRFNELCRTYGHNKQKGQILSAALLMFLEADPREQAEWIDAVRLAETEAGMRDLLERIRLSQSKRVADNDASSRPARAAKARRSAQKPLGRVPRHPPRAEG